VSHQLRTPITALRLKLEAEAEAEFPLADDVLPSALADLDRIEQTIEHLLAVARDSVPTGGEISLDDAVRDAAQRWSARARAAGRTLTATAPSGPAVVRAQKASVDEVLNVLIDNSLRHGRGAITVSVRHLTGGVAVDVADEGASVDLLDAERIFTRGHTGGDGDGIGLAVARSIAEAEGGRLVLTKHRPTTFSLLLIP
jgi:signal transduction histidine kinase